MSETTKVTDAFTYSNGNLETVSSSTWDDMRSSTAPVAVSGNAATNTVSSLLSARHTGGSSWTAEQWGRLW
jgi:hypothetical protein